MKPSSNVAKRSQNGKLQYGMKMQREKNNFKPEKKLTFFIVSVQAFMLSQDSCFLFDDNKSVVTLVPEPE